MSVASIALGACEIARPYAPQPDIAQHALVQKGEGTLRPSDRQQLREWSRQTPQHR
ncbi:hypothetical protein [Chelativorans sp. J32]|uniref:hypothetical protein n=1 Tax=Chelativorans sp. J32 TaxID=935840 RepID=UPI0004AD1C65|nr:hypothetical protein [Chelativorans sp. J32]